MTVPARVYVGGEYVTLDEVKYRGEGGEARIYQYDRNTCLRILKFSDDECYRKDAEAQRAADKRLEEYQHKVLAFPKGLPANVLGPLEPVYAERGGRIIGHSMRWVDGAKVFNDLMDPVYRQEHGITQRDVMKLFEKLYDLL